MAAYYATNLITGNTASAALTGVQAIRRPPPTNERAVGSIQAVRGTIVYVSGVNNLVIDDVIELAILPAGCVLTGWELWNDDFDTATTLTIKIGLMTGTPGDAARINTAVGVELLASGSATLQAPAVTRGSVVASIAGMRTAWTPAVVDRSIGLGVVAAPTNPATTRQLDFVMFYKQATYGA